MAAAAEISELMKSTKIEEEKKNINILLLGTTGVGKSTFINSIANYLTFADFDTAKEENLNILIPCTFNIWDRDQKEHTIKVGKEDKNETQTVGDSATQDVKTYVFPIKDGKYMVRLIDTPGMGDTRGIKQDNSNSENILAYIGNLEHLHAICYLLKSNETRCTVFFEYCLTQIFSRLDKSATDNLIFIFTNTRGTDYSPGDTMSILQKSIDDIAKRPPYVRVPTKNNIFCFENESFKYLAARKHNVKFAKPYEKNVETSWIRSSEQCWKLIKYITGNGKDIPPLTPHLVQNTKAINEARRMITYLSKPLADIAQLIHQNMWVLQRHRDDLTMSNQSLAQLRKKMYMPVVTLEVEDLPRPATVCTTRKCAELYKVGDKDCWHYKQRCHDPCYLQNVPKEIIGSPELVSCAAMSNKECNICGCYFSVHMHVYYFTRLKDDRIVDDNVVRGIQTKEEAQRQAESLIAEMDIRQEELEQEHKFIVRCSARFAHFLQNNAITPFTDSYKAYIQYLLEREKALGKMCDKDTLRSLQRLLDEYEEARRTFDLALEEDKKLDKAEQGVTSSQINSSIQGLFGLKHYGEKIKEMLKSQQKALRSEHSFSEYIHNVSRKKKQPKEKNERQQSSRGDNRRTNNQYQSGPAWQNTGYQTGQNYSRGGYNNQAGPGRFPPNQDFNWGPNQRQPNWGAPPSPQMFPNNWTPPQGFPPQGFYNDAAFQEFMNNVRTQGFAGNWTPHPAYSYNQGAQPHNPTGPEQNLNLRVNTSAAGEPNIDINLNSEAQNFARGSQENGQQLLLQENMKKYFEWYKQWYMYMYSQATGQYQGPNQQYNYNNQDQWRDGNRRDYNYRGGHNYQQNRNYDGNTRYNNN